MLWEDPWKLLVACMLLNKTAAVQVRRVIWDLFRLAPTPEAMVAAPASAVGDLLHPLGLYNRRAAALRRFSAEWVAGGWTRVRQLHGVGQYASDAHALFCGDDWRGVAPADKDLRKYAAFLRDTGGLGVGLAREALPEGVLLFRADGSRVNEPAGERGMGMAGGWGGGAVDGDETDTDTQDGL